jgi:hypothetical protein|tara:strand:+ start:11169 stop:11633 length:465 start_codon:yes stop_codon:yes gene_type:complete
MAGPTENEFSELLREGFEYTPPVDSYEHTPEYYDRTRNIDPNREERHLSLNFDKVSPAHYWKYSEDLTLNEVKEYLSGTYRSHYTSKDSKTQTLDLIESIGDGEAFCRSNAIKYLSRFGKKDGKSKRDILKAIHYCILLYHFAGLHQQQNNYNF